MKGRVAIKRPHVGKVGLPPLVSFYRAAKIIAILILLVESSVVIWRYLLDPDIPLMNLTKSIEREIPAGSTKSRVLEFLESRHIRFSGYDIGPDPLYGLPEFQRERKRYVLARVPTWGVIPYFSGYDIRIVFYFDEEELLSEYKLEQLYDGP